VVIGAFLLLALTVGGLVEPLRKGFFPQVGLGAFEIIEAIPEPLARTLCRETDYAHLNQVGLSG
jgi:hypothetical protein